MSKSQVPTNEEVMEALKAIVKYDMDYYANKSKQVKSPLLNRMQKFLNITDDALDSLAKDYRC